LLRIENYSLSLRNSKKKEVKILDGVSLALEKGKCLGIAGESGSGKSMLSLSIPRLIPPSSIVETKGEILFEGKDLLGLSEEEMRILRGKEIAFIFQEPLTAMNPIMPLQEQLAETIYAHEDNITEKEVFTLVLRALELSGFPEPEKYLNAYPYQLSGGMQQRALIAMALILNPKLIIADEPTTAIDVSLQVQLLERLKSIIKSEESSMIFITHDLGVLRVIADELAIMYCGLVLEYGKCEEILKAPKHPYTSDLIAALPRLSEAKALPKAIPGFQPSPERRPAGCVYAERCSKAIKSCFESRPYLADCGNGVLCACFLSS